MIDLWRRLSLWQRAGWLISVLVIVLLSCSLAWWAMRGEEQVLFSDLTDQDAAAFTTELEKLKIPYQFDESRRAILVRQSDVHSTRLKLMGAELPLRGVVGFELFNTSDFGMTDFAQRINYQRALQGELTRTIGSLAEIREVRVHLALPEQGLFKEAVARPKAAVTLALREGAGLRPEQVLGIQRLVAAATPGMKQQDVTVVDRQGIALSRVSDDQNVPTTGMGSGTSLELKQETEQVLSRKAGALLDKAFGAGQAIVSVDVVLNLEQARVTLEDVVPSSRQGGDSKGVIVRERESVRDSGRPALEGQRPGADAGVSSQREVEYQVGRRVEQVVTTPGAVRRIQLVAVIRQALDPVQQDQWRRILSAAVGAHPEQGDVVVVQSIASLMPGHAEDIVEDPAHLAHGLNQPAGGGAATSQRQASDAISDHGWRDLWMPMVGLLLLLLAWGLGRRRVSDRSHPARLSEAERLDALQQVRSWLRAADATAQAPVAAKSGPPT